MRRAEIIGAFFLGLLSIYLMWKSGEPPAWNPDIKRFDNIGLIEGEGPGSGFWPFWLSAIMLICCVWIGWNWYKRTSPPSQSEEPFLDSYAKRMLLLVGGGLFGFLALIHVVGFYGGMFIFMAYYLGFLGRHSIVQTLTISTAVPVISFFFFDVAMRIVLPKGYLEPLFLPLYDIFL
ncbi:MAG: tripartite tricarboxylate transporter TctB family protein [Rhodospirillaceae bacterium]|jgi:putative tricarboxylic transport membrane protein|nr:tripartite tricarboxylate transporter TctB family protein [Rhodospirillaceae bacterium]